MKKIIEIDANLYIFLLQLESLQNINVPREFSDDLFKLIEKINDFLFNSNLNENDVCTLRLFLEHSN